MTAEVSFRVSDSWSTGLVGAMTIRNDGSAESGWTVTFDADFEITNIWNAEIVSRVGSTYTLRNAPWNGTIAPHATVEFGFQGAGGGTAVSNLGFGGAAPPPPPLPRLSIADAQLLEGDAGESLMVFTVSLSAAATGPVSVGYATSSGTAIAGEDFAATSGTLSFAAGETSRTVAIRVQGDTVAEANQAFSLVLANPAGATIADGQATGTILNDDGPPPPPDMAEGFLGTSGNQIVGADGKAFQINAVNWFGMETTRFAPDGLHVRGYRDMMDQMKALGFNAIRLPFSGQSMDEAASTAPTSIDYQLNPDLQGLRGAALLDRIVAYAGEIGLKIILDHHRSSAGDGPNPNGLWYDATYTEARWIAMWQRLAERYADDPTVIAADLQNEPHGANWADWAAAAERAGNAIHAVNPGWLIVVEGVGQYQNNHYWWGGNLMGVRDRPVRLALDGKLVYSPHDYPNSIYPQPWFSDPAFPANLPAKFDQMWGFIHREGIAPVFLGEFGTRLVDPKDAAWLGTITAYLDGDFDADGDIDIQPGQTGMSWAWWSWNPNSGDTGGILQDDWRSVHQTKLDAIARLFAEPEPPPPDDGSGPETITGTAGAELLDGRGGDDLVTDDPAGGPFAADTLQGGEGDDRLVSRGGGDLLDGGAGFDLAVLERGGATGALTLTAPLNGTGLLRPIGEGLSVIGIEAYAIRSGAGADRLTGGNQADSLAGGGANDTLSGRGGDDTLRGEAGNDELVGGAGADLLDGGAGIDVASYANAPAGVVASLASPGDNAGDAAGDTYASVANLRGSGFADRLVGDQFSNALRGGDGDDTLHGGGGADMLFGQAGNDRATGGAGADRFVATPGQGADVVTDFTPGTDRLDLSALGIASAQAALAMAVQQGANLLLDLGGGQSILLAGVQKAALSAGDFILG